MVTDRQVRLLMELDRKGEKLETSAAKAGMDAKTARKYRRLGRLPSQVRAPHVWRTRVDPFSEIWEEVRGILGLLPGVEAKTLFEHFQREHPGRFSDGQLRTFQRRVKQWRALEGPAREVFFAQVHYPGDLSESDFTYMNSLGVTINHQSFDHLVYHFVLTYSNWETGTICFSESFESLSQGLQDALWKLGGVPKRHRSDRLSAAVHNACKREEFTARYQALLKHYRVDGEKIRAGEAHENGDVEQGHYRLKRALDQAFLLRGSRDFGSREEYAAFLARFFDDRNAGRRARLEEELAVLGRLPERRFDDHRWIRARVGLGSTVRVADNSYSVSSRLRGEVVDVKIGSEELEVWYGRKRVERIPRLRGKDGHRIDYRHIIDWLVRKPGAFENYRWKEDLFPTTRFRMAYDSLRRENPLRANREYVGLLYLAAKESEAAVNEALRRLLDDEAPIGLEAVRRIVQSGQKLEPAQEVHVQAVDLAHYDELLGAAEVSDGLQG